MVKVAGEINYREYLEIFQQVTRMTTTLLDHQEVMDTVVRRLPEILELDAATIRLLDPSTSTFVLGAAHGLSLEYLSRDSIDTEETMATIRSGKPVARTHLDKKPDYCNVEVIRHEGIKSILSLPILFQGTNIGVMRLLSRTDRTFSTDEISFTMSLAEQVGMAISNARLFKEMENQIDFLKDVHDISRLFNTTLDLDKVLASIVKKIQVSMRHKGCAIRLVQPQTNLLEQVAAYGMSDHFVQETRLERVNRSLFAKGSEPLPVFDVSTDTRLQHKELLEDEGICSLLLVPIRSRTELIGVLEIFSDSPHFFSSSEINFIKTIAESGSVAIQNARTYRQITLLFNQLEENERFLADILNCLRVQIMVVDSEKHIVMVNHVFLEKMQLKEENVLGIEYDKVCVNPQDTLEFYPVNKVLETGKSAFLVHQREIFGTELWFERSATPMFGSSGDIEYVIEVIRDVTIQRQLEIAKLNQTKLKGVVEMAGAAAHEINSPLFAALGTAQLLRDDLEDEEAIDDIDIIIRNLDTISSLTRKMIGTTGFNSTEYVGGTNMIDLGKDS